MNRRTLGIVMAHQGTEEVCRRHLPIWQENAERLIFFSPGDSVVQLDGVEQIAFGTKCHHGRMANERFRFVIQSAAKLMLAEGYGRFVLHEYDSLCVGPLPETPKLCLAGNEFKDHTTFNKAFAGYTFIHPPLIIWLDLMMRLSELLEVENMNGESGYWDRFIGHMCEGKRHGIPVYNLRQHGLGYSQNTIAPEHFIEVRTAKINGARLFHGIKTEEAFKVAIAAPSRRGGRAWAKSR